MVAYDVYIARAAGPWPDDIDEKAEAGAIVRAEESMMIVGINKMMQSYIEAMNKSR